MVNYGNVINLISPSISKSLGKKWACHLKIVAFKNCVWLLWNCFMDLEFVVSLRILGFMERNLWLKSSYDKNCQTQSIRHIFTMYLPVNSALVNLDMNLLFVRHSLSTRNDVISVKCDPYCVFQFNIYPIIGTVFLWENAFYLCICLCIVYVYIERYFVHLYTEKKGWLDQCVETCIPHNVNIVHV